MTKLLIKLFVKDKDNVTDPAVRGRYAAAGRNNGNFIEFAFVCGEADGGAFGRVRRGDRGRLQ